MCHAHVWRSDCERGREEFGGASDALARLEGGREVSRVPFPFRVPRSRHVLPVASRRVQREQVRVRPVTKPVDAKDGTDEDCDSDEESLVEVLAAWWQLPRV